MKSLCDLHLRAPCFVAPYAGAWIEIFKIIEGFGYKMVAPYAGAWIEMLAKATGVTEGTGRTLRGCVD